MDIDGDNEQDVCCVCNSTEYYWSVNDPSYYSSYCELLGIRRGQDAIHHMLARNNYTSDDEEERQIDVGCSTLESFRYNEVTLIGVVVYDLSGFWIRLLSTGDLSVVDSLRIYEDVIYSMMSYRAHAGAEEDEFIVMISRRGNLYSIGLDGLELADRIENFAPEFRDAYIGNFDDDEDMEMAVLTADAFIMYDLGRLSAPTGSQPPWTPETYSITAAYPNPFNSRARIEYTVPLPGFVTLTVHDLSGRTISRLSDGWQNAGDYNTILNADNLPGGAYLIRLEGNQGDAVRVVQVVK